MRLISIPQKFVSIYRGVERKGGAKGIDVIYSLRVEKCKSELVKDEGLKKRRGLIRCSRMWTKMETRVRMMKDFDDGTR